MVVELMLRYACGIAQLSSMYLAEHFGRHTRYQPQDILDLSVGEVLREAWNQRNGLFRSLRIQIREARDLKLLEPVNFLAVLK